MTSIERFKLYLKNENKELSDYLSLELEDIGIGREKSSKYVQEINVQFQELLLPIGAELFRIREMVPHIVWKRYKDNNIQGLQETKLLKEQQTRLKVAWKCLLRLTRDNKAKDGNSSNKS